MNISLLETKYILVPAVCILFFNFTILRMNVHSNTVNDLKLSIKSDKGGYRIGEPIFLDVTIENLSSEKVLIRQYLLLPADDPRNNIRFEVTENKGQKIERISHTITGRALVSSWSRIEKLELGQTYTQTFQVAGMYKRKLFRKTSVKPLWALGEEPEIYLANEYPVQEKGGYKITVIYENTDDGSNWPREYWDHRQKVWTGKLISNTIEVEVVE